MLRRLVVLVGGILLLSTSWAPAQDAILGQMYGAGVHAYYSNDYYQAHEKFSAAIKAGSRDPRCYYYRGLCLIRLGRSEDAQTDFQMGAKLETEDINKFYSVPAALQRIQGSDRVALEKYRTQARMVALQREQERRAARYGEMRQEEQRVLQQQAEAAPATPPAMSAKTPVAEGTFQSGPIEEPKPEKPAAKAEEPAADAAAPAADADPFAAEPVKKAKPVAKKAKPKPAADDDPFGAAAEKPAAEKPADEMPADDKAADENPADKKASDDPFGAMPAEKADDEPAEKPAAGKKKAAKAEDDNPFGDMTAEKPAAKEKEEAKEDKASDNPFMDEPKAEKKDAAEGEEKSEKKEAAEDTEKSEKKDAADDSEKKDEKKDDAAADPFGK